MRGLVKRTPPPRPSPFEILCSTDPPPPASFDEPDYELDDLNERSQRISGRGLMEFSSPLLLNSVDDLNDINDRTEELATECE